MEGFADTHVHIKYEENDKTIAMFDEIKSKGVTDIAIQALVKFEDYGILQNIAALNYKMTYKGLKIRAFGNIDDIGPFKHVPYERQAEALLDMGCDGIKMLNQKPDTRKRFGKGINHNSYDAMFSLLEERGTPVLIHSGDPEDNWDITKVSPNAVARGWFYGDGTFLTPEEIYAEDFEMLDKHPNLNVTFAHFFFLSNKLEEAIRVFEKYPNVKFDLTPGGEMFYGFSKDIDAWHDFFEKYSDRILFGTDSFPLKDCNGQLNDLVLKRSLFADYKAQRMGTGILFALIMLGNVSPKLDLISIVIGFVRTQMLSAFTSIFQTLASVFKGKPKLPFGTAEVG